MEGIGSTGRVKRGQQQRGQNREEHKLPTVYWMTGCCIDQKWCCWTTVPLYAGVPGELVPQFILLKTLAQNPKSQTSWLHSNIEAFQTLYGASVAATNCSDLMLSSACWNFSQFKESSWDVTKAWQR